jgi:hypothetical protein
VTHTAGSGFAGFRAVGQRLRDAEEQDKQPMRQVFASWALCLGIVVRKHCTDNAELTCLVSTGKEFRGSILERCKAYESVYTLNLLLNRTPKAISKWPS